MDDHRRRPSHISRMYRPLESTLKEILSFIKPGEEDRLKREITIAELDPLLQSMDSLKGAVVMTFGSFVSNIYTKWGDLDITIVIPNSASGSISKYRKRILLRDIMSALRRTGWGHGFDYIPEARVPILKYESSYENVHCDISIDKHVAPLKSKFLLWITQLDWRFLDLVLLIKEWAKAHKINDPKSGTLNSYSLCLLVIFHFQTCEPAILPPLKEVFQFNDLNDIIGVAPTSLIERDMRDSFAAAMANLKTTNTSSLSELLVLFIQKFRDIKSRSSRIAICTYTARWEDIWSKVEWKQKSHCLIIEDPFERPDNAARAVDPLELTTISDAFFSTHLNLNNASLLSKRSSLLDCLVRPAISMILTLPKSQCNIGLWNAKNDGVSSRLDSVLKLNASTVNFNGFPTNTRRHQPAKAKYQGVLVDDIDRS